MAKLKSGPHCSAAHLDGEKGSDRHVKSLTFMCCLVGGEKYYAAFFIIDLKKTIIIKYKYI